MLKTLLLEAQPELCLAEGSCVRWSIRAVLQSVPPSHICKSMPLRSEVSQLVKLTSQMSYGTKFLEVNIQEKALKRLQLLNKIVCMQ